MSDRIHFVAGHWCSQASIPASKVYEHAEILMIAPGSVNSALTDEGGPNVFRVCGRDDQQATMVADYLARHWAGNGIAVVDDGTVWGKGIADKTRVGLRERNIDVGVDEAYAPGQVDFTELLSRMQAAGIDVVFVGGFHREAGLILRQARERGYGLQLIANSAMALEDFPLIAGPALEGTVMAGMTDTRDLPQAADVVARFRADGYEPLGYTLYAYAAVQVWAQAVTEAESLDLQAVTKVMHSRRFDTVLGTIGFDEKGDVTGFQPWQWFVWQADGSYVPLRETSGAE